MSELIVAARLQSENDEEYVRSSKVGISTLDGHGEIHSTLFDPENPTYAVNIAVLQDEGYFLRILHIFVERWMRHAGIDLSAPFQVWRWHVDAWPLFKDMPAEYCLLIERRADADSWFRFAFEHVHGPELVNPYLLAMELAADKIQVAEATKNLVPERDEYRSACPYLRHPGMEPEELGILGAYEDLLKRLQEPKPTYVM